MFGTASIPIPNPTRRLCFNYKAKIKERIKIPHIQSKSKNVRSVNERHCGELRDIVAEAKDLENFIGGICLPDPSSPVINTK